MDINQFGLVVNANAPHLGGNVPGGDPDSYCPELWDYLARVRGAKSVLCIGAGTGETARYFQSIGCHVLSIDGLPENVAYCPPPALVYEIGKDRYHLGSFDLAWCCEVVEHISENHISELLRVLGSGRTIAMTHAAPGQPGHNHVNCQPAEYWVEKITSAGYVLNQADTDHGRRLCVRPGNYFHSSGLIFVRLT